MKFQYFNAREKTYLTADSYDVASALRGPDTKSYDFARRMKRIFTHPIRHYAHCSPGICTGESYTPKYIKDTLAIAKTIRPPSWWEHWAQHVHLALIQMERPDLLALLQDIDAAFLGPTQSHHGVDNKELYYCIKSDGNRLALRLSLKHWGLGVTLYISKRGWNAGLHLLCGHVETSGWFKSH